MDVENLGQVFTPDFIVDKMVKLIENEGSILEPSAGDGAFVKKLKDKDITYIEIDKDKAYKGSKIMDFFDYSVDNKFDTIIGNPPYVRYQDITEDTKKKLKIYEEDFDKRSNLFLFFIYKSIEHLKDKGELIFIVPREFLKATSAKNLNKYIYDNGTITYYKELGDSLIFKDATPNTVIFRFEKGNFTRKTNKKLDFKLINGQLLFLEEEYPVKFNDLFFVKVGAVSGADKIFENKNGNKDFVCSYTNKTGKTKTMYYNVKNDYLKTHKKDLLNRKIRKFNKDNWYKWGRSFYESEEERIYVNQKTRNTNPFFYNQCKNYDGSILAVFFKFDISDLDIKDIIKDLNSVNWKELGFCVDGRFIFNQRSLENTVLPKNFKKYLKYINEETLD